MFKKLAAIILGCLAIIVVSGNCAFTGRLAWAESEQTAYVAKSSADSQSLAAVGDDAAEASDGKHEGRGGAEEAGKFPGYEVALALVGCAYFALIMKVWPVLFGKREEGHQ